MFPVSKFSLSRYFEIASLFPVSKFLLSHYYEITSLFPVSKFLLSRYYEIRGLFPISKYLLSRYFEIAILLRDILRTEMSARDGDGMYVVGGRSLTHVPRGE